MPEETTALAVGVTAKGSTVMLRPPRSGAGSQCSGIKLRLTTLAGSPQQWTQAPSSRPASSICRGRNGIEQARRPSRRGGVEMANARLNFIGEVTQIAGVAAVVAGVVLSLHHWPAAVALIGGGAAFYVGKKLPRNSGLQANR